MTRETKDRLAELGLLYDVLIYNCATGIVSTVVQMDMVKENAEEEALHIDNNCSRMTACDAFKAGEYRRGDEVPMSVKRQTRMETRTVVPRRRKMTVIEQRIADSQCVLCGSPQLFTKMHCELCSKVGNERVWMSKNL